MDDLPFDLSKFDPSTLNLSHLHPAERDRILRREFYPNEVALLLDRKNPWTESGKPKPLPSPPPEPKEPTLDDLRRICHADTLPLLERGDPNVRAALEAQWRAANPPPTAEQNATAAMDELRTQVGLQLEDAINPRLLIPKRVVGSSASPTAKEQAHSELLRFMEPQVRAEYEKADSDQRKVIWEANKQAFEAAKKRKEEKLLREQELMAKVYDLRQRVKEQVREDPSKHHLLPPNDASTPDLRKWYEEMQKPVRPMLFPGSVDPPSQWTRMDDRDQVPEHPSPLWAVLGFLRKWTALGGVFFLGATWTMIQIDEYALASVLLVIGMFAFSVQIYDWNGIENHRKATRVLKGFAVVLIVGSLVFFGAVIAKKKGVKPWSNLMAKETPPEVAKQNVAAPLPSATGTIPSSPTPSSTPPKPSPSPSAATQSPALAKPPVLFPSDVKMAVLQCSVSEYDQGYKLMKGAICIAKHQETGQEFVGSTDHEGTARINLPYGFYIVTIKADGYITQVEGVRVDKETVDFGALLQKTRK